MGYCSDLAFGRDDELTDRWTKNLRADERRLLRVLFRVINDYCRKNEAIQAEGLSRAEMFPLGTGVALSQTPNATHQAFLSSPQTASINQTDIDCHPPEETDAGFPEKG